LLFLQLLKQDYGVCAQLGVKSGALDSMGIHGMKTIVIDLEPDTRLRLRMARFATVSSNYFIVYPNYKTESTTITFPVKLSGKLVLHQIGENPQHGKLEKVTNIDSPKKQKPVEYEQAEVDWETTLVHLLKKG